MNHSHSGKASEKCTSEISAANLGDPKTTSVGLSCGDVHPADSLGSLGHQGEIGDGRRRAERVENATRIGWGGDARAARRAHGIDGKRCVHEHRLVEDGADGTDLGGRTELDPDLEPTWNRNVPTREAP